MSVLSVATIEKAREELGQHEQGGNNLGSAVQRYLATVGLTPPQPWCAAFVCTAVANGAKATGVKPALKFSASAIRLWTKNPNLQIAGGKNAQASDLTGTIFCIEHPLKNGVPQGHTGFVVYVDDQDPDLLHTLEGNTGSNLQGAASRDGDCVCLRTRRRDEITLGFLRIE